MTTVKKLRGLHITFRADGSVASIARRPSLWALEHLVVPHLRGTDGAVDETPERPAIRILYRCGALLVTLPVWRQSARRTTEGRP